MRGENAGETDETVPQVRVRFLNANLGFLRPTPGYAQSTAISIPLLSPRTPNVPFRNSVPDFLRNSLDFT